MVVFLLVGEHLMHVHDGLVFGRIDKGPCPRSAGPTEFVCVSVTVSGGGIQQGTHVQSVSAPCQIGVGEVRQPSLGGRAIIERLNREQKRAAAHRAGPALAIAAAGLGKTAMLIARIVQRIESGVDPSAILACTFTRKATDEMRSRLEASVGETQVSIGTMHSGCRAMVLPEYGKDWAILADPGWMLVKALEPAHPKYNPHGIGLKVDWQGMQMGISRAKADGLRPRQVQGDVGLAYEAGHQVRGQALGL